MSLSTGFQPLYKQVYDLLTERLANGFWKPSQSLPSEMALAEELGVSQGTVRKALNQMVAEKLLERQQGKGTYVAEHTEEDSLFRFFRLRDAKGERPVPETEVLATTRRAASDDERIRLQLDDNLDVVERLRRRSLKGVPSIVETIIQPLAVFPDIDKEPELPNYLYALYQEKYNISIVSVRDRVQAVGLPEQYAQHLNLAAGSPVLMVERVSINIDGRPVECSRAYCTTEEFAYSVHLK